MKTFDDDWILEKLACIGHKLIDKVYSSLGIKRTFQIGFDKDKNMGVIVGRKAEF